MVLLFLLGTAPSFASSSSSQSGSNSLIKENSSVQETRSNDFQQARTKKIKGVVTDEKGEPIIGANVAVRGTTNGTITGVDGDFTLDVPNNAVLVISYIGYSNKTIQVGNTTDFKISLKEDSQNLDEIVVVGYGSTSKRALISSVSQVKASEMVELPVTNITQGLAGRSPGLIVQGSGGGINKKSIISIRGGDTPLVVIDGIIRDYNDFVALSPENIETLSILKDASATAVYGSRSANGILQVTTKSGSVGKPRINYGVNFSWSQPMVWPKKLSSYEIASYKNEAAANDNQTLPYNDTALQKYKDGSDPINFPNTNLQKEVMKNWAPQSKHMFDITGGNEAHRYYASVSHIDQNSLYRTNTHWMKQTNFQLKEDIFIKEIGVKATVGVDGYLQTTRHPYTSTSSGYYHIFSHVNNHSAMSRVRNDLGNILVGGDNPVAETAEDAGYLRNNSGVINGQAKVEWALPWVKGLSLRAQTNYRYYDYDHKEWRKDPAQYEDASTTPTYASQPLLSQTMTNNRQWNQQYFVDFNRQFGEHSISALAGYEQTYSHGHSMGLSRYNYQFNIDQINVGPASTKDNWGSEYENGREGYIGQVKYNFKNRYFAEGSMRYDGSDNFPKNHRWGTFWSGSLGWSIGDEAFMAPLRDRNIINMLKLRASYGQIGLDNWSGSTYSIGRFAYMSSYSLSSQGYVINGAFVPTFSEGALVSPDITWFSTDQTDVGFDFTSLSDRLYGSFDYFYYKTKGFLYSPDALVVGYTDPLGKSLPKVKTDGEYRREGFEVQLGWRDHIGDLKYDVSFNATKFNEIWANNPAESLESKKNPYTRTTQQTNYYGVMYHSLGFFKDAQDVYNSAKPINSSNLTAGDIKYEDVNGDGVIDGSDNRRVGSGSFPLVNYGFNINLGYKGFAFSTLFQGATKFDFYLGETLRMASAQSGTVPMYSFQKDYWTPTNTNARFPRLISQTSINNNNNNLSSDFWLINGAYLRMKDIRISYDLKYSLLKRISWLQRCSIGLSGQNIFTISETTKYGLDPENGSTERYDYPNERVYAVNLTIGF